MKLHTIGIDLGKLTLQDYVRLARHVFRICLCQNQ
jgi:hypothetical protein